MEEVLKNKILKNKLFIKIGICTLIFLVMFLGAIYAANYTSKGELNDDGKINYADVSLLELHLAHLKALPEDKLKNADMNSDGEITITDLNLLIKKVEKALEYEVTIRDIEISKYYPNKNEEITLNFDIDVSYDVEVKTITINEVEYEIVRDELNKNLYEVKLNVGNTSGVKEYKLEKVTLINGEEFETNEVIKVDVLREQPKIENWALTEDIEKSEINISFDVVDNDRAIESGIYKITEKNVEASEVTDCIKQEAIVVGTNNINVKVEKGKRYQISVDIQYNLDTDTLEQEGDNTGRVIKEEELILIEDYKFQLSNIKTYKDNDEEEYSQEFNLDENIVVKFDSTNETEYLPEFTIINGKKYNLKKEDDTYTIFIDGFNTTGNQFINIEKVILNNGKAFEINQKVQVK